MKELKFIAKVRDSGTSTSKIITVPVEVPTKIGETYQFSIIIDD